MENITSTHGFQIVWWNYQECTPKTVYPGEPLFEIYQEFAKKYKNVRQIQGLKLTRVDVSPWQTQLSWEAE